MNRETWTAVDQYLVDELVGHDEALEATLAASAAAGLPGINVTPTQGKLLHLLARMLGARRILEIGTLGGYSTIWLARALPADGKLITLEADARHADVARGNVARAGLQKIVDLRLGPALDTLPRIDAEHTGPFDLFFIDADKENTPRYFEWAMKLSRRGSVIIVDNVVRRGAVADPQHAGADVQGIRRFNEMVAADNRVSATAIQTVGSKGYDGFALVLVTQ
jgi:predicted O-methyltransferase YrrM